METLQVSRMSAFRRVSRLVVTDIRQSEKSKFIAELVCEGLGSALMAFFLSHFCIVPETWEPWARNLTYAVIFIFLLAALFYLWRLHIRPGQEILALSHKVDKLEERLRPPMAFTWSLQKTMLYILHQTSFAARIEITDAGKYIGLTGHKIKQRIENELTRRAALDKEDHRIHVQAISQAGDVHVSVPRTEFVDNVFYLVVDEDKDWREGDYVSMICRPALKKRYHSLLEPSRPMSVEPHPNEYWTEPVFSEEEIIRQDWNPMPSTPET